MLITNYTESIKNNFFISRLGGSLYINMYSNGPL